MNIVLPVQTEMSENPATLEPEQVRRVTVQLTEAEAEAVASGDAAAVTEMGGVIGAALTDAGVGS